MLLEVDVSPPQCVCSLYYVCACVLMLEYVSLCMCMCACVIVCESVLYHVCAVL